MTLINTITSDLSPKQYATNKVTDFKAFRLLNQCLFMDDIRVFSPVFVCCLLYWHLMNTLNARCIHSLHLIVYHVLNCVVHACRVACTCVASAVASYDGCIRGMGLAWRLLVGLLALGSMNIFTAYLFHFLRQMYLL